MNSEIWKNTNIKEIYDRSIYGQMKADIFRYCILYERGGFYIDIARKLPRKWTSYIQVDLPYVLFFSDHASTPDLTSIQASGAQVRNNLPLSRSVSNSFLAFKKKHKILEETIHNITEIASFYYEVQASPRNLIITLTGPGALTRAVWTYAKENRLESECIKLVDSTKSDFNIKNNSLRYLERPYYGLDKNKLILRR